MSCTRLLLLALALILTACNGDRRDGFQLDDDFPIPRTEAFPSQLSAYGLYQGAMVELQPAPGVHVYEIPSELFTDYAKKQRLLKLPEGQSATVQSGRLAEYPDGTVVAKTFYYPVDYRDASLGQRVIETRLLVKTEGTWNVATYIWNDEHTDAELALEGATTTVDWIAPDGRARSTEYEVPGEVACVTCHQSSASVALIGLTPRNLNREVMREGQQVNQLEHLQAQQVVAGGSPADIETIIDYRDSAHSLEQRARAYLDANCSHCHSPGAWEESASQDLDLRYETSLADSGLLDEPDAIARLLRQGEMPYVGTTVLHDEGIALILEYLDSL